MKVEGAEAWHLPYFLRKHTEGNHHKEVRLEGTQLGEELRVLQLNRLKHRDIVLHGIFLHSALVHFEAASARLVGDGHYAYHLVFVLDEGVQRGYRKFRGAHIDDSGLVENGGHAALELAQPGFYGIHIEYW